MHSHLNFQHSAALAHDAVAEVLERALKDQAHEREAADALVGSALNDDQEFVEHWCMQVGMRAASGSALLGLAGLCLGHTARRFGHLSDESVALARSLAARADADPSDVDRRALDGLDDVQSYLPSAKRLRLAGPGVTGPAYGAASSSIPLANECACPDSSRLAPTCA